jgi:SAM-dependent methyltransferase
LVDASPRPTSLTAEPGSFRDWDGRVFSAGDRVVRALSEAGLADWQALVETELLTASTTAGELIATEQADDDLVRELRALDPAGAWSGALVHERLPFVSYPYEWSFSMLRDAAQLQLRLLAAAVREGMTLKDATPYNIQWRGARPVFIDIGSFQRGSRGEPWAGYRQFCMLFLYPLMLEAYRGVAFQPWLRGSIDGIAPKDFRGLFTWRDMLRRGMTRHVFLHASLERRYAPDTTAGIQDDLREAGFDARVVAATVSNLSKLVSRLDVRGKTSAWSGYQSSCSYEEQEIAAKEDFVRRIASARARRLVWDLGCNDGRYSRIASEQADFVVAVDSDRAVVDALYGALHAEGSEKILPLVVDLADPSPAIGWANAERTTLTQRGHPDLVLCLALVHHLSITRNIPLREVVAWLRGLDSEVVVEFPHRSDPMVQRLLAAKPGGAHPDYGREAFEDALHARFAVAETVGLASGTRTLYHAVPR